MLLDFPHFTLYATIINTLVASSHALWHVKQNGNNQSTTNNTVPVQAVRSTGNKEASQVTPGVANNDAGRVSGSGKVVLPTVRQDSGKENQEVFLTKAYEGAVAGGHIFPAYAACEVALETGFGTSVLCREANNLFGMKQHFHPLYGSLPLPTKEFLEGQWKVVSAEFIRYPSWGAAFADRMATLKRLVQVYPHYAAAVNAIDGATFINEVSRSWSTDPARAKKVLDIYEVHKGIFNEVSGKTTS